MTSDSLELARGGYEDIEYLEQIIVCVLKRKTFNHAEKIDQSLRISNLIDKVQSVANRLKKIYKDSDHFWKHEIDLISGLGAQKDSYATFYERLNAITNFYNKFPHLTDEIVETDNEINETPDKINRSYFSGAEGNGCFIDLHAQHIKYMNSKFGSKCSYADYVKEKAWSFDTIAKKHRTSKQYNSYLTDLVKYMEDFFCRSKPLESLEKIYQNSAHTPFKDTKIKENDIGSSAVDELSSKESIDSNFDISAFSNPDELESLGANRLKLILQKKGLKCGGKLSERAFRLWNSSVLNLKRPDNQQINNSIAITKKNKVLKEVVLYELKLIKLSSEMQNVILRTLDNIEAKSTKTCEELEEEQKDNENIHEITDFKDDSDFIYNPLKLPLGPDDKPIPYWLYKLHGLNRKFECEICGNYVYEGRRAFEKHFNDSRHQLGMQALGIPNDRMFYEITKINDAIDLWNTFGETTQDPSIGENQREFEDYDGNLYDKETYELLKKQGLV